MAKEKKQIRSYKPRHISDKSWYYEERRGLDLHIWMKPDRALSKGESYHVNIVIPWKLIRDTAKHLPKVSRKSTIKEENRHG